MKTNKWLVLLALLFAMVINVSASTASDVRSQVQATVSNVSDIVSSTAAVAKQETVTNVNQAVVSILMGAKSVGSDLYSASKEAIHKSVDFVSEQAPDVVRQFLLWRATEATVYSISFLIISIFLWYIGKRIIKFSAKCSDRVGYDDICSEQGFMRFFGYLIVVIGFFPFFFGTVSNLMKVLQIWIAPKIYLIDYIVSLVKNHN